jgi:integrase
LVSLQLNSEDNQDVSPVLTESLPRVTCSVVLNTGAQGSALFKEERSMSDSYAVVQTVPSRFGRIQDLVLNAVGSVHSRRAYARSIAEFLAWYESHSQDGLTKATVQQYRAELEERGLAPSSINLKLSAVRRLAAEAADNGLLAPELAAGIARVKGARMAGVRTGYWLTREQAEALIHMPDRSSRKGKRDRVILALLIGCGLRRTELAQLRCDQVQQRDGRWIIADLRGKGGRLRTVPIPVWIKPILDAWQEASGITAGPLLRPVDKSDRVVGTALTAQALYNIVKGYGVDLGVTIAPHDLRRTFAKLAHRGHAAVEQIQLSLGHASVLTTERYLGVRQDLADAPCDHLGLKVTEE